MVMYLVMRLIAVRNGAWDYNISFQIAHGLKFAFSFNELLILTGSADYCIIQARINILCEAYKYTNYTFGNLVETFQMQDL